MLQIASIEKRVSSVLNIKANQQPLKSGVKNIFSGISGELFSVGNFFLRVSILKTNPVVCSVFRKFQKICFLPWGLFSPHQHGRLQITKNTCQIFLTVLQICRFSSKSACAGSIFYLVKELVTIDEWPSHIKDRFRGKSWSFRAVTSTFAS